MNRRAFLKAIGSAALLPMLPRRLLADAAPAASGFRRRRPSDPAWPSQSAWRTLQRDGQWKSDPGGLPHLGTEHRSRPRRSERTLIVSGKSLLHRRAAGLTESSGWLDAWASKPSVYAVSRAMPTISRRQLTSRATMICAWRSKAEVIAIRAPPMRPIRCSSGRGT